MNYQDSLIKMTENKIQTSCVLYYRFMDPFDPPMAMQEAVFEYFCQQRPFRKLGLRFSKVSLLEDCFLKVALVSGDQKKPEISTRTLLELATNLAFCQYSFEMETDRSSRLIVIQKLIGEPDDYILRFKCLSQKDFLTNSIKD